MDLVTRHVPDVRPADVQATDHGVVRIVADYGQTAPGRLGDQREPDIAEADDRIYHQDWHVEDDPAAATAFRRAAPALTLARP